MLTTTIATMGHHTMPLQYHWQYFLCYRLYSYNLVIPSLEACILGMLFNFPVFQFLYLEKWKFYLTYRFIGTKWVKTYIVLNTRLGTNLVLHKQLLPFLQLLCKPG